MGRASEINHRLGPFPGRSIAVLVDLGMTDALIARYLSIDPQSVRALRNEGLAVPLFSPSDTSKSLPTRFED